MKWKNYLEHDKLNAFLEEPAISPKGEESKINVEDKKREGTDEEVPAKTKTAGG